eukprot:CAMPEP_0115472408 /NCGR_PEP_ID=MMETSP0271-20121206/53031_1 /TAXON_ID=71861 /ORGANISM="Scrippsiella trochoidea, Strain CCMP3099" /LENGTH=67 /DNA_ID=CAMNT_0002899639 /DNA_START=1024 /DNA_END=1227 /DNA_ORIENTATION=+
MAVFALDALNHSNNSAKSTPQLKKVADTTAIVKKPMQQTAVATATCRIGGKEAPAAAEASSSIKMPP